MTTTNRVMLVALWIVPLTCATTAVAQQDEAWVGAGEAFWEQGAEHYADRDYQAAIPFIVQAIQAEPDVPRYYRGLARTLHFAGDYDQAVYYYDLYLSYFPDFVAAETSRHNRESTVRRERERANDDREDSSTPPGVAAAQLQALSAVESRLAAGPMMAYGGGGAYSLYRTLMRTGYAHPNLVELRTALVDGLLAETEAMFLPPQDSPMPIVAVDQWREVPDRYAAVEVLGRQVISIPGAQARMAVAGGHVHLANGSVERAASEFARAIELDPELLVAYWGLILARHEVVARGQPALSGDTTLYVDALERLTAEQSPEQASFIPLARSLVAAERGDYEGSAAWLLALLAPGHLQVSVTHHPGDDGFGSPSGEGSDSEKDQRENDASEVGQPPSEDEPIDGGAAPSSDGPPPER